MQKRVIVIILVLAMLFGLFTVMPMTVNASNVYWINGVSVSYDDFSSSPNECWVYANNLYNKIWGCYFSNSFDESSNSLRNLSDSELTLTTEHLKDYVTNAELGSCLRICNGEYLHGTDGWGHSQLIVQKDSNGFTVFEGGLSAYPYCREKYYTWSEYINTGWLGGSYQYIKYIKWPGAAAYSRTCTVTFDANGGSCSVSTKTVSCNSAIGTLPTATRSGYEFTGWYTAASGGTKVTESTTISSDTTIYAQWTTSQRIATYYNASGAVWKTETVSGNSYTICADYPKQSGNYFSGWAYTKDAGVFSARPRETVSLSGNINLYPVYVTHERAISGEVVPIYNIADFTTGGYDIATAEYSYDVVTDTSYWTDWSDYSINYVAASETRQVRTKAMYRYYYYLCPSCGAHEPFWGTSDCGAYIPQTAWHMSWSITPYSQSNWHTFSYTSIKYWTDSLGDGQMWIFSSGNLNDTAPGTIDSDGDAAVIDTGYSYRDYICQTSTVTKTVTGYRITPYGYQNPHNPFTDVAEERYYYKPVLWAVDNGITNGVSKTRFAPNETCTRAQVVTFLWRAAGCPEPASTVISFPDVPAEKYYTKAILWAAENGITNGRPDGTFCPYDTVTRAEFVTFLWRAQDKPTATGETAFRDVPADKYYTEAIAWAAENGITTGIAEGVFGTYEPCTRAHVVTFLYRACGE